MPALSPRLRVLLAWLPASGYTLLIWWLSSQTLDVAFMKHVPFADKGVHFLEYGVLAFLIAFAAGITWPARRLSGPTMAAIATAALGLLDELHQGFVPGRFADVFDLLADALGSLLAAALFLGCASALRALRRRA